MNFSRTWILIFAIKLCHCEKTNPIAKYEDFRFSFVLMICDFNSDRWRKENDVHKLIRDYSNHSIMAQAVGYEELEATREIVDKLNTRLLMIFEIDEQRLFQRGNYSDDWSVFLESHRNFVLDDIVRISVWDSRNGTVLEDYFERSLRDDRSKVVNVARMNFDFRSENFYYFFENFSGLIQELSTYRYNTVVEYDTRKYNTNWSDLIKDLSKQRMNMALTPITMSMSRINQIDFSLPIIVTQAAFYMQTVDSTVIHWSSYFRVFSRPVWLVNAAMVVLVSCLLMITKKRHHRDWHWSDLWSYNFVNIVGIYAQQGLAERPRNPSSRLLYLTVLWLAMNVHMLYSSVLMSFITVPETGLPFSSYLELKDDRLFKIIVLNGSRQEARFHESGSLLHQFEFKLNKTQPLEILDAFLRTCNRNQTVAFYTLDTYYNALSSKIPCVLKPLYLPIKEYMSIGLSKNEPYREELDNLIITLSSNGFLARLRAKYFFLFKDIHFAKVNRITINSVMPILTIYVNGVMLSLIILTVEIIVWRKRTVSSTSDFQKAVAWKK
ncbi:glutamate receptor ionotropic, kainate 5-like [Trichogramma pretiosum]|uniref:glutamate receptor ionotropic, kainate 5-like n=1 Tax=Trichogramma pretiosum TaxID=7493 RepID=UPI0006C9835A|nr:glutamate receptor ionotropic, kainate 5-like [Trichogramma pretiosum]